MLLVHPSASIAETSRVASTSRIGPDVVVGQYSIIEDDVEIGARCRIEPHVVVKRWTSLGTDNEVVSSGAVLGTDPLETDSARLAGGGLRCGSVSNQGTRASASSIHDFGEARKPESENRHRQRQLHQ